ncbi:hypothetical protein SLS53_008406 [Cytospora paraplurivora]|uniref:Alpha/beta hydrolase fold-3 domain-containing protein n=1 Tax=Cytospora paraplurivora TaxID=2898453 RepID=A0AAN9U5V5_9PEZI
MTLTAPPAEVAIIGAGLALGGMHPLHAFVASDGLTLALALHDLNVPSTVYESRSADFDKGGGVMEKFTADNIKITTTTLPDTDLYLEIYSRFISTAKANKDALAVFGLPIQKSGPAAAQVAKRNSSNIIGISPRQRDQTWWNPIAPWTNSADDGKVHDALLKLADYISGLSQARGIYGPFIFSNIASHGQNVLASYGSQDLDFLRAVSAKYGPTGIFQRLQNGGFLNGPTLLYIHGGGYRNAIIRDIHIPLVVRWAKACKARQVILLEYGLTPRYKYPTQLVQAAAALHHLLEVEGLPASEIIIGGDSAGGGIVASLLVHLVKPYPYAIPVNMDGNRFKGVLFISPWVVMSTDQPSYEENTGTDWVPPKLAPENIKNWAPDVGEVWAMMCEAEGAAEVWSSAFPESGRSTVAAKVLVTAGMGELLHDGIVHFATDFIKAKTIVVGMETDIGIVGEIPQVLVRCPDETHVQPGVDLIMKYEKGGSMRAILTWLERL